MAEQELWTELLKQMHRRYEAVNEVFRLTKEIADTLSRDDRVAAQMLLECVGLQERSEILGLLKGEREASPEASFEEKRIGEIGCNIRRNLEKILEVDRVISVKLAGKDSFYQK